MKQIASVEIDDMKDIGPKYVAPLLDTTLVKTAVVCHSSKVEEISAGLRA